ncbi:MAG: hypothetical protein WD928_04950 [Gammaproteobacteria bacterium]
MVNRKRIVVTLYRAWRLRSFAWGSADCLHFASACAAAITGHDPATALKRRYSSETGARRVMVNEGWRDMGDVAASLLPEIPLAHARSGDWAHVEDEQGRDGIGVVCGHMIAARTEAGMGQVPLSHAKRAFRVE